MKVRLNLATAPLASNRRFVVGASGVAALAILGLILLSLRGYREWSSQGTLRTRQAALEQQIGSLHEERQQLSNYFNQPDTVKRRERAAYLNGLIKQRAFPWIKIFTDLERILPEGVRVVSVEPKLAGDNVQLRFVVGALSDEGKLKFLRQLESSPEFSQIHLLTETRATRPEQADRVMLEMQAIYSAI